MMGNIMAPDEYWATQVNHWNKEIAECGGDVDTVKRLTGYLDEAKAKLKEVAYFEQSLAQPRDMTGGK